MARQFFYLVCAHHNESAYHESTYPQKVFLQEHEAIRWGRREASKSQYPNYEYSLYKQEIARTATLKFVKTLSPYKEKEETK